MMASISLARARASRARAASARAHAWTSGARRPGPRRGGAPARRAARRGARPPARKPGARLHQRCSTPGGGLPGAASRRRRREGVERARLAVRLDDRRAARAAPRGASAAASSTSAAQPGSPAIAHAAPRGSAPRCRRRACSRTAAVRCTQRSWSWSCAASRAPASPPRRAGARARPGARACTAPTRVAVALVRHRLGGGDRRRRRQVARPAAGRSRLHRLDHRRGRCRRAGGRTWAPPVAAEEGRGAVRASRRVQRQLQAQVARSSVLSQRSPPPVAISKNISVFGWPFLRPTPLLVYSEVGAFASPAESPDRTRAPPGRGSPRGPELA